MSVTPVVDAVTIEVTSQNLGGIVQEMQNALFCTGYSTIIRESRDASCAILDPEGRVLSQFTVLPLHLGAFPACVESLRARYEVDELEDGDAFIVNHPYLGGSPHASDMAVISPIIVDDELFGFSCSIAHKSDIGGLVPGSNSGQAREIFHEGIMIPPVRLYRAGVPVAEVEAILGANSRTPELVLGDLRGQVGATWLGASRVRDLCAKHGADVVAEAAKQLYLLTERRIRAAVAQWPDGVYEGSACMHSEGIENNTAIFVRVKVEIAGERATFDFSESDDQLASPFNVRPPLVRAVCSYVLKCLIDPELPSNQGMTLAVDLITREGTVVDPRIPAPVNTYMPIANVAVEAVLDALRGAVPKARIAGSSGGLSGTLSHGARQRSYPQVQYELSSGAIGARADKDGVSASKAHVANGTIAPIEIVETEFPVEVVRFELLADSGGAGRFRGGLCYVREYRMLGDSQLALRRGALLTPPPGQDGGLPGAPGANILNPGTSDERHLSTREGSVRLGPGEVLRREMTGSGGYGDPLDREVEQVLDDVREGYVTPASAEEHYGVVVVPTNRWWDVDPEATEALRASRRAAH